MPARVVAVSASPAHHFCKTPVHFVALLTGSGMVGDAIAIEVPPQPHRPLVPV